MLLYLYSIIGTYKSKSDMKLIKYNCFFFKLLHLEKSYLNETKFILAKNRFFHMAFRRKNLEEKFATDVTR